MTSFGDDDSKSTTKAASLEKTTEADAGRAAELAIADALSGLDALRELPVVEHVERFESAHAVFTEALDKAEAGLPGSSGGS